MEESLVERFEESTGFVSKRLEGRSIAKAKKNRKGEVILTMSNGSRFRLASLNSFYARTEAVSFTLRSDSADHAITGVTVDVDQGAARFFVLADTVRVMTIDAVWDTEYDTRPGSCAMGFGIRYIY